MLGLLLAGCQGSTGEGTSGPARAALRAGGAATLVSPDGAEVLLDRMVGVTGSPSKARASRATRTEKLKLPVGTRVRVEELVGDDAHVVIEGGPSAAAHAWVECSRLEPASD